METRKFGNSDMAITPVGYGAWAIGGGDWEYGWGSQEDKESIDAIHRALDLGVNWIDTAAVYGLGHSEEVVARALKGRSEKPYVFTKCSLLWNENGSVYNNLEPDSIRQEVEDSLRRLEVDVIDLYQIHWPNPDPDIRQGWETLAKLKEEGKVRYIGVSNFNVEQMERVKDIAPITSLQPPYSLIKRGVEDEILPYCKANNIGVIVYSPMQAGLLTGAMTRERIENMPDDDWRPRDDEFQDPKLTKNLKLQDKLQEIAEREGRSKAAEVSVAWVLHNDAVTGAIVGARRPSQVDGWVNAGENPMSDAVAEEIEAYYKEVMA